jgi:aflatoxin B1 aldehyde reductase
LCRRERYFKDTTFEALKIIEPVIEKHGLTMIETALRWLVHHSALNLATRVEGGNDGIIIGVSSRAQLEGNLRDLEKPALPEEVVQALDAAWRVCKGTAPNYWHGAYKYEYDTREALFGEGVL